MFRSHAQWEIHFFFAQYALYGADQVTERKLSWVNNFPPIEQANKTFQRLSYKGCKGFAVARTVYGSCDGRIMNPQINLETSALGVAGKNLLKNGLHLKRRSKYNKWITHTCKTGPAIPGVILSEEVKHQRQMFYGFIYMKLLQKQNNRERDRKQTRGLLG